MCSKQKLKLQRCKRIVAGRLLVNVLKLNILKSRICEWSKHCWNVNLKGKQDSFR